MVAWLHGNNHCCAWCHCFAKTAIAFVSLVGLVDTFCSCLLSYLRTSIQPTRRNNPDADYVMVSAVVAAPGQVY